MKSSPNRFFAIAAFIITIAVIGLIWYFLRPENLLWVWLAAWSVTAFVFYGYDKAQAKRGAWRIPEIVLHGVSLIGGFIGALIGMYTFRHKTQKPIFLAVIVLSAALWIGGWWFLLR